MITVLLLASCGISEDREPRVIAAGDAPIDLSPEVETPASGGSAQVTLYFVQDGALTPVNRSADAESLEQALPALLAGPDLEQEPLLSTRIPIETVLRGIVVDDEVATIDLGCATGAPDTATCGILGVQSTDQAMLFGQLTCTAELVPGISGVRYLHEGQPQRAPLPDGTSVDQPVRCRDYRSLSSPPGDGAAGSGSAPTPGG